MVLRHIIDADAAVLKTIARVFPGVNHLFIERLVLTLRAGVAATIFSIFSLNDALSTKSTSLYLAGIASMLAVSHTFGDTFKKALDSILGSFTSCLSCWVLISLFGCSPEVIFTGLFIIVGSHVFVYSASLSKKWSVVCAAVILIEAAGYEYYGSVPIEDYHECHSHWKKYKPLTVFGSVCFGCACTIISHVLPIPRTAFGCIATDIDKYGEMAYAAAELVLEGYMDMDSLDTSHIAARRSLDLEHSEGERQRLSYGGPNHGPKDFESSLHNTTIPQHSIDLVMHPNDAVTPRPSMDSGGGRTHFRNSLSGPNQNTWNRRKSSQVFTPVYIPGDLQLLRIQVEVMLERAENAVQAAEKHLAACYWEPHWDATRRRVLSQQIAALSAGLISLRGLKEVLEQDKLVFNTRYHEAFMRYLRGPLREVLEQLREALSFLRDPLHFHRVHASLLVGPVSQDAGQGLEALSGLKAALRNMMETYEQARLHLVFGQDPSSQEGGGGKGLYPAVDHRELLRNRDNFSPPDTLIMNTLIFCFQNFVSHMVRACEAAIPVGERTEAQAKEAGAEKRKPHLARSHSASTIFQTIEGSNVEQDAFGLFRKILTYPLKAAQYLAQGMSKLKRSYKIHHAFKVALAVQLAGAYAALFRHYDVTAALTVGYVLSGHLGASFKSSWQRVEGVVAGTVVPALMLEAFYGNDVGIGLTLVLWVMLSSYIFLSEGFHSYAGVVSAFTAPSIMLAKHKDEDDIGEFSMHKIQDTFVACFLFAMVELWVLPLHAENLLRTNIETSLKTMSASISLVLHDYAKRKPHLLSKEAASPSASTGALPPAAGTTKPPLPPSNLSKAPAHAPPAQTHGPAFQERAPTPEDATPAELVTFTRPGTGESAADVVRPVSGRIEDEILSFSRPVSGRPVSGRKLQPLGTDRPVSGRRDRPASGRKGARGEGGSTGSPRGGPVVESCASTSTAEDGECRVEVLHLPDASGHRSALVDRVVRAGGRGVLHAFTQLRRGSSGPPGVPTAGPVSESVVGTTPGGWHGMSVSELQQQAELYTSPRPGHPAELPPSAFIPPSIPTNPHPTVTEDEIEAMATSLGLRMGNTKPVANNLVTPRDVELAAGSGDTAPDPGSQDLALEDGPKAEAVEHPGRPNKVHPVPPKVDVHIWGEPAGSNGEKGLAPHKARRAGNSGKSDGGKCAEVLAKLQAQVSAMQQLLKDSKDEPRFWRDPFPTEMYTQIMDSLKKIEHWLSVMNNTTEYARQHQATVLLNASSLGPLLNDIKNQSADCLHQLAECFHLSAPKANTAAGADGGAAPAPAEQGAESLVQLAAGGSPEGPVAGGTPRMSFNWGDIEPQVAAAPVERLGALYDQWVHQILDDLVRVLGAAALKQTPPTSQGSPITVHDILVYGTFSFSVRIVLLELLQLWRGTALLLHTQSLASLHRFS